MNVGPNWGHFPKNRIKGGHESPDSTSSTSSTSSTVSVASSSSSVSSMGCDDRLADKIRRHHSAAIVLGTMILLAIAAVVVFIVVRMILKPKALAVPKDPKTFDPSAGTAIAFSTLASSTVSGFVMDMYTVGGPETTVSSNGTIDKKTKTTSKVGSAQVQKLALSGGSTPKCIPLKDVDNYPLGTPICNPSSKTKAAPTPTGCPFETIQPGSTPSKWSWTPINPPSTIEIPEPPTGATSKALLAGILSTSWNEQTMYLAGFTGFGPRVTLSKTKTVVILSPGSNGAVFIGFPSQQIQAECMPSPVPTETAWAVSNSTGPASLSANAPTPFVFRGP